MHKRYKYIYGPVYSWRLGSSLGVDLISREGKTCTFDCLYCQIGPTKILTDKRDVFVPTKKVLEEIESLPPLEIDYITFSGRGEPTIAKNLGEVISGIRKIRKEKIAIITNSSLIDRIDVQLDLKFADLVMAKLDVHSEGLFSLLNRPIEGVKLNNILKGIKEFKSVYKGKLALQIMFTEENKSYASEIRRLAEEIGPDEVQLNTALRPCALKALSQKDMDIIKGYFKGMDVISLYDAKKKKVVSINREDTLRRRGS